MKTKTLIPVIMACSFAAITAAQNKIDGLTIDNYPRVDGSTSTLPLNRIIACNLFGIPYTWEMGMDGSYYLYVPSTGNYPPTDTSEFFQSKIKSSQTHPSFINLIDGETDLILSARKMSAGEKAHAQSAGVELIETPIALDAFIFLSNVQNPIISLTKKQVQDIYTGRITHWSEVGGNNTAINPYVRNDDSGSQELMESLVMSELEMPDWPDSHDLLDHMPAVFSMLTKDPDGICYTVYYYMEHMMGAPLVKSLAINNIHPDATTIADQTYPLVAEVYAVIRSDQDKNSMTCKLYDWLRTDDGQATIAESGYVPCHSAPQAISPIPATDVRIYPNPVADGFYVTGLTRPAQLTLVALSGSRLISTPVANGDYIRIASLPAGIYIATVATENATLRSKIIKK
jgi:phosphate transport system substrate-binding protein